MKNNVTNGLFDFGQPVDPRQADARALQAFREQALMQARLTPMQQVSFMGQQAGFQLGGALGRLMGGKTQEEVQAAKDQETWQRFWNPENPAESYVNLANYLESQGRVQEADQARMQGLRVMQQSQQMTEAKQAQAEQVANANVAESMANIADPSSWTPEHQLTLELANAPAHKRPAIMAQFQEQAAKRKEEERLIKQQEGARRLLQRQLPDLTPDEIDTLVSDPKTAQSIITQGITGRMATKEQYQRKLNDLRLQQEKDAQQRSTIAMVEGGEGAEGTPLTPQAQAAIQDNLRSVEQTLETAEEALQVLTEGNPTASGLGSLVDKGMHFFGKTTEGAMSSAQLKVLAGRLTSAVPRMQGPQSDKDVQLYKEMAGNVGDETLPMSVRLAALDQVITLNKKYREMYQRQLQSGRPGPTRERAGTAGNTAPAGGSQPRRPLSSFGG